MIININIITAEETIPVRQQVLRIGKPLESCILENDLLKTTLHLGLQVDNNLVGVVSIFKNSSTLFNEINQFQIRGMAILQPYQKRGFGEKIVDFAESEVISKNGNLIWCNARENAFGFYQKMKYLQIGDVFNIEKLGTHAVMFKKI